MERKIYDDLMPLEAVVTLYDKEREEKRNFLLTEMTCARVFSKYTRSNLEAYYQLVGERFEEGTPLPQKYERAILKIARNRNQFFADLLVEDMEGDKVDAEWVALNVSDRMRSRIIQIQDELNNTVGQVGNAKALIMQGRKEEVKQAIMEAGKTEPPNPNQAVKPKKKKKRVKP